MELLWKDTELDRLVERMGVGIPVEGDIPLPEGRACTAVLCAQAEAVDCACVCGGDGVDIEGSVRVSLLCEDGQEVFAFVSRAAFTHTHRPAPDYGRVRAACTVRGCSVRMEGEALRFFASVWVEMLCLDDRPLRTLDGVRGVSAEELQCQEARVRCARRAELARETLRVREEVAAPGVQAVLLATGTVEVQGVHLAEERGTVEGILSFSALMRDAEGRLTQSVQHVPFRESFACTARGAVHAACTLADLSVRSVGEAFGILAVEAQLALTLYTLEAREALLPTDAYAPSLPFACTCTGLCAVEALPETALRRTLTETVRVPDGMPEISRVLCAVAQCALTTGLTDEGDLCAEGVLETRVVYESESGMRYVFNEDIPASFQAPLGGGEALVTPSVLCTASGGGRSVELQYTLCLAIEPFATHTLRAVDGVCECAAQKTPAGILVCFAGKGETLYDVAKRYNTTRAALRRLDPALTEELCEGQKIVMLL